jgi:cell division protein ZapB
MSNQIFVELEAKIDQALETLELLRLQIEESEEKNQILQADNLALKNKQGQWEHSLTSLLRKLETSDLSSGSLETAKVKSYAVESVENEAALVD